MLSPRIKLSKLGPQFSRIVAGAWRMSDWGWTPQQRLDWIKGCLDLGVTTFDHADIYGGYTAEEQFGEALALEPGLRQHMQLVSKTGIALVTPNRPDHRIQHYNTSRQHIIVSAERSLRNLHTDHLDLLLIHRPSPLLDADEVAEAFHALHQAGKVRHFGVSNFTPRQFELMNSRFPLVTNQVEVSPLCLDTLHDGTLDQMQQHGIAPMAWSPLSGGRLFSDGARETRVREVLANLPSIGNAPADEAAYAWLLRHPARLLPITGSSKLDVIRKAVSACSLQMDEQDWFSVWVAATGHAVP